MTTFEFCLTARIFLWELFWVRLGTQNELLGIVGGRFASWANQPAKTHFYSTVL